MTKHPALRDLAIALALTAAAALPAMAQEATADQWLNIQHTQSRAEVGAALAAARADGSLKAWSAGYIEPLRSTASRDTVRAATREAIARGEVDTINAEAYEALPLKAQARTLAQKG